LGKVYRIVQESPTSRTSCLVENLILLQWIESKYKMIIDAATGRALMKKECDEAYKLLEEMALNR